MKKAKETSKGIPESNVHKPHHDSVWRKQWDLLLAAAIIITLLTLEYGFSVSLPPIPLVTINLIAYFLAGRKVLWLALKKSLHADFFNEFVLMSVATIGAFVIGEYEEGVAVMVFYQVGEWFQHSAVDRAKSNIKALLDIRPDEATVIRNNKAETVDPTEVKVGETIQIKAGEKVALDGKLISAKASFNTSALTGESTPDSKYKDDQVLAGMINLHSLTEIEVTAEFKDSKLNRILEMVQDATSRKSQTQLFISRFAKVYTPIVFFLALSLVVLPYFFVSQYVFEEWFYRSLVFLVISCPCALVISIPLGYFGGIGLASRNGILFKGGNFLDVMTQVKTVVMDKTGTLTKGVFHVQEIVPMNFGKEQLLQYTVALEQHSTHPIAKAITSYAAKFMYNVQASEVEEIAGHGLKGIIEGKETLVGNLTLLKNYAIDYPAELEEITGTTVYVAINGIYAGHITIADEIKDDAQEAIDKLHALQIRTVILSGDKSSVVQSVAKSLGIDEAYGGLLPEDKVKKVEDLKKEGKKVAFVGDGVNDAPVIAIADVGIAMGGLGSDATIETADVVIQNDQPSKIAAAIKAGKITKKVVWQNIILALAVKILVLTMGAAGVASLWEAVIADVGVALLAILNAVRIQHMKL